jgi:hypothetical protein
MATEKERAKIPRLVQPHKGTSDEALALIFAPLKRGDGFRHGALGAPGFGKTFHMNVVVDEALDRGLVDIILTHDTKGAESEFIGVELASPAAAPPPGAAERHHHLVYRGDVRNDVDCPVEDVALFGKRLAQKEELRVLLNVGELDNCLTDGGRSWEAPTVRWFSSQGRKLRACLTWTNQQPKRCPDEIFDQSTTIAFLHLDARSSNYLGNTLLLDPAMVEVLPRLAIGEFVLWVPGGDWNRRIYRF